MHGTEYELQPCILPNHSIIRLLLHRLALRGHTRFRSHMVAAHVHAHPAAIMAIVPIMVMVAAHPVTPTRISAVTHMPSHVSPMMADFVPHHPMLNRLADGSRRLNLTRSVSRRRLRPDNSRQGSEHEQQKCRSEGPTNTRQYHLSLPLSRFSRF